MEAREILIIILGVITLAGSVIIWLFHKKEQSQKPKDDGGWMDWG